MNRTLPKFVSLLGYYIFGFFQKSLRGMDELLNDNGKEVDLVSTDNL